MNNQNIGSSDAPVIMGVSPYKTPFQLWEERTRRAPLAPTSFIQERGNRREPYARALYELQHGIEMGRAYCRHYQVDWLVCEMDGWNPLKKRGIEIKAPGREEHELARSGQVPAKYMPQVQHQIAVTGATVIDFCSYYVEDGKPDSKGELLIVPVTPDMAFIQRYVARAKEFRQMILDDIPPPFMEADYGVLRVAGAKKAANEYLRLQREILGLQDELQAVEEHIFELAEGHGRCRIQGTKVLIEVKNVREQTHKEIKIAQSKQTDE